MRKTSYLENDATHENGAPQIIILTKLTFHGEIACKNSFKRETEKNEDK